MSPHQSDGEENLSDMDSDHSSVSSKHDERKLQKKKAKKKKRRGSKDDDAFDWQYNKLTVPQSSPPRERKGIARKPTPRPAHSGEPQSISTETGHEFNYLLNSPSLKAHSSSSSQISPPQSLKHNPTPSQGDEATLRYAESQPDQYKHTDMQPKRAAPISLMGSSRKLPPKQAEVSGSQGQLRASAIKGTLPHGVQRSDSSTAHSSTFVTVEV